MRLQKRPLWENLICRFLVSSGIPSFTWNGKTKRFEGVSGFSFVRIMPRAEGGWANLPLFFRRYEGKWSQDSRNPVVMLCTSKENGPNIEDTLVVMRFETYASMLVPLVASDPSRYLRKE